MHSVVRHPLPGRLRFALRAIHQNREAACALEERLGALDGVALVRVFPERGQVSVRFNPGQIDAKALLAEALSFSATWEQVARSQGPTPGELALSVLAPGVLLAAVAGKRALSGPSPASQAPELSFAAAAVGAAAGYPLLRQGLKRAGGPRTEAWLAYSGLGLLLVRESVSGLAALLLLNLTRWLERDALTKAYAEAAAAQQAEAPGIQPPMPALEDEPASMTQAALGVAAATTLGTRDLGRGLAVLIAALPRVRELASSLTSSQAMAALANHGVIPQSKTAVRAAGAIDAAVLGPDTIWLARPKVTDVVTLDAGGYPQAALRRIAAALLHDVSEEAARSLDVGRDPASTAAMTRIETPAGVAMTADIDGKPAVVGPVSALEALGVDVGAAGLRPLQMESRGDEALAIAHGGVLVGLVAMRWVERDQAGRCLEALRHAGVVDLWHRSGSDGWLRRVAHERLGVHPWPEGTTDEDASSRTLLSIGPPPATGAAARVVVAASRGSAAAKSADVLLTRDALEGALALVSIGQSAAAVRRQNEVIGEALTAIGIPLAVSGRLGPAGALFWQDIALLLVLANAGRLAGRKGPARRESGARAGPVSVPPSEGQRPEVDWHRLDSDALLTRLETSAEFGLDREVAANRLERFGPNALAEARPPSLLGMFLGQFKDLLVLTLLGASGIAVAAGRRTDALTIWSILALNGVFGVMQEYQTSRTLASLSRISAPLARAVRGGEPGIVPAATLVPGDVVELLPGDRVPADARLIFAEGLEMEESSLTGESLPVPKRPSASVGSELALGERLNMVYMGTSVARGRGRAVIVATGMGTEMGYILAQVQHVAEERTPLQRQFDGVGRVLFWASLGVAGAMIAIGLVRRQPPIEALMTGVSLAVAAIPEGLPTMVMVALTAGVRRMGKEKAIVRRLSAVETLATTSVLCSDKTGTLTEGRMHVHSVYVGGRLWNLQSLADGRLGVQPDSGEGAESPPPHDFNDVLRTLTAAAQCHDGQRTVLGGGNGEEHENEEMMQDPIDAALQRAYRGLGESGREAALERVQATLFDAVRRRVSVLLRSPDDTTYLVTKGAAETLIPLSTRCQHHGRDALFSSRARAEIEAALETMMAQGLRVIAVAYRPIPLPPGDDLARYETDLTLLGLIGLVDPVRPTAAATIAKLDASGVNLLMLTGDHPKTAMRVAEELGLLRERERVLSGSELERMDDDALAQALETTRICARVTPDQKLRVVRLLRASGRVVAMIGDGVNDGPALKEANVGIAMGPRSTDLARQVSAMVFTDDDFGAVATALEHARGVRSNIRRALGYLLAGNMGEVLLMLTAGVIGEPFPLDPIQLLVVNLLSDGVPALLLAAGTPTRDPDQKPGDPADQGLLANGLGSQILVRGSLIGLGSLGIYAWGLRSGSLRRARSLALASIVLNQWAQVFDWQFGGRRRRKGEAVDPWMVGAVGVPALLLPALFRIPALQGLLRSEPLSVTDWLAVGAVAAGAGGIANTVASQQIPKAPPVAVSGKTVPGVG